MGVFEYLGVILSVIMGLGVTHILAGLRGLPEAYLAFAIPHINLTV
jgi:hypothetical protein